MNLFVQLDYFKKLNVGFALDEGMVNSYCDINTLYVVGSSQLSTGAKLDIRIRNWSAILGAFLCATTIIGFPIENVVI